MWRLAPRHKQCKILQACRTHRYSRHAAHNVHSHNTRMRVRTHRHTHAHIHTHVHTHTRTRTCMVHARALTMYAFQHAPHMLLSCCTHARTHARSHACIHTHAHTCPPHTHTCTRTHARACTCMMHAHTHTMYASQHAPHMLLSCCTHTHTHACTHVRTRTRTHAHTHTHTHMLLYCCLVRRNNGVLLRRYAPLMCLHACRPAPKTHTLIT